MAAVIRDPAGLYRVGWTNPDRHRYQVRLGRVPKRTAQTAAGHIERLLVARTHAEPIPPATLEWLAAAHPRTRRILERAELVPLARNQTLAAFLEQTVMARRDVKTGTRRTWQVAALNLRAFLGDDRPLRTITPTEALAFRNWLHTRPRPLAAATIAARLGFVRAFFEMARRLELIASNPFRDIRSAAGDPTARQRFVDRPTIARLLEHCPPDLALAVALSRFGGLRCPSEVLALEWRHIDWTRERILVTASKTGHYADKGTRTIPLYPELAGPLRDAWERAVPGQTHVVADRSPYLIGRLARAIEGAGLERWPRIWHNLRSSRETELLERFPGQVVARWQGHSPAIAAKHYAQVTEAHYAAAVRMPRKPTGRKKRRR